MLQKVQSLIPTVHSMYRVRHKSVNTPLSHERLVGGLQDGGRGIHVTHFVQLYPQPLYTASQVRTTCRSWDEEVLTNVCLTGVLTDLCLTLYFHGPNVTLLGEGGLQAAHVVGWKQGIHQGHEQEHAMHRNPQAHRNKLFVYVN